MEDNYDMEFPSLFKLGIADGLSSLMVSHIQVSNFWYILPVTYGRHIAVGKVEVFIPMALQIEWYESSPFFCAVSETAQVVISDMVKVKAALPWHKF